jgi:hypothetical protein
MAMTFPLRIADCGLRIQRQSQILAEMVSSGNVFRYVFETAIRNPQFAHSNQLNG